MGKVSGDEFSGLAISMLDLDASLRRQPRPPIFWLFLVVALFVVVLTLPRPTDVPPRYRIGLRLKQI